MCAADLSIRFIGHAGFYLSYRGTNLLVDPWLSESGAFLSRWHQYPPNDFLNVKDFYDADYLYLSHDHQDHFDMEFLRDFPKDKVTILIAHFLSDHVVKKLQLLGFSRIRQLPDWQ